MKPPQILSKTVAPWLSALSFLMLLLGALLYSPPSLAVGNLMDVNVIDVQSGERLKIYTHEGKMWIAGQAGRAYAIELKNASKGRLLGVISIDGVNVISGNTAHWWDNRGYILDAGQQSRFEGWRKSLEDVAQFYFTPLPNSYAARTGREENVGVINVAVFREKTLPIKTSKQAERDAENINENMETHAAEPREDNNSKATSPQAQATEIMGGNPGISGMSGMSGQSERVPAPQVQTTKPALPIVVPVPAPNIVAPAPMDAPPPPPPPPPGLAPPMEAARSVDRAPGSSTKSGNASALVPDQKPNEKLGTGHGQRIASKYWEIEFETASSTPDEVIAIGYDSRERLMAMGVIEDEPPANLQQTKPLRTKLHRAKPRRAKLQRHSRNCPQFVPDPPPLRVGKALP